MAASMIPDASTAGQKQHLIDELESSFHNCVLLLTSQDYFNLQDSEETKTSVENAMTKFLDLSRQTEAFFLRKKLLASYQKPEQMLNDDIGDLKAELARKEQLLEKNTERLKRCQIMLQAGSPGVGVPQQPPPPPQHMPQQMPQQLPPPHPMAQGGPLPQYSPHHMQQMPPHPMGHFPQGPPPGPQGFPPTQIHTPPMQGPPMPHPMGMPPRPQPPSYPQGPLAFLEQTTSNIGLPDRR